MEFEQLYERYYSRIFTRAMSLMHHRQAAEDVTQETFLRAWRAWPPHSMDNLYSWLYTIVTHHVYDLCHRGTHVQMIELSDILLNSERVTEQCLYEPMEDYIAQEMQWQALARLEPQRRRPLVLFGAGYSYKEIARIEHVNVLTLHNIMAKARKQLRAYQQETENLMSATGDALREYLRKTGADRELIEQTMTQITVFAEDTGQSWDDVAQHLLCVLQAVATPDDKLDPQTDCY